MKYSAAVITAAGLDLIQRLLLAENDLTLTCVKTGSGSYTSSEDLKAKTSLKTVKQSFLISQVHTDENHRTKVSAVATNEDLEASYYMTEVGLYANDPDNGEILFSLAVVYEQSQGDFMPADDGKTPVAVDLVSYLQISDDVEVTISSDSGYAALDDFMALEDHVDDVDTTIENILGDIGRIEETAVATKNYSAGEFLVLDGFFYKAKTSITSGETLVVGTNIERTTVSAELDELNSNKAENNISGSGYCKMPDGTMIEWGNFSISIPANSYAEQEITFPVAFSGYPSFAAGITAWADPKTYSVLRRAAFGASGTLRIGSTVSSATTVQVDWIAVGRWK